MSHRNEEVEYVDIGGGAVQAVTAKAVLLVLDDIEEPQWLPLSTLEESTAAQVGEKGDRLDEIYVAQWIAEKEGLA